VGTRAFVAARYVVAPMGVLADELHGLRGEVLSLGSGLCMLERYLAELEPALSFDGIDLDPVKVRLIHKTQARSPRVTLELGDATAIERSNRYDVVLACDAMHHFPADRHGEVVRSMAAALKPGGVAVVKDLDVAPLEVPLEPCPRPHRGGRTLWCRGPADMAALFDGRHGGGRRIDGRLTYAPLRPTGRKPS
jgi:SAM-dependent methyltransferase